MNSSSPPPMFRSYRCARSRAVDRSGSCSDAAIDPRPSVVAACLSSATISSSLVSASVKSLRVLGDGCSAAKSLMSNRWSRKMTFFESAVTSRDVLMSRSRRSLCASISLRKLPNVSRILALDDEAWFASAEVRRSSDRVRLFGCGRVDVGGDAALSLRASAMACCKSTRKAGQSYDHPFSSSDFAYKPPQLVDAQLPLPNPEQVCRISNSESVFWTRAKKEATAAGLCLKQIFWCRSGVQLDVRERSVVLVTTVFLSRQAA